jgi:hypothetical protein
MDPEDITKRIDMLLKQQETAKNYMVDRIREEDWQSVVVTATQLHSINQELDTLQLLLDLSYA